MLDKRQIWAIFLSEFKKGQKVAETTCNTDNAFGPGRRRWHPLQCSCLENPMDGGAWQAAVHGVAKSRTWLSDFTFTFHFPALEKEMATLVGCRLWGRTESDTTEAT